MNENLFCSLRINQLLSSEKDPILIFHDKTQTTLFKVDTHHFKFVLVMDWTVWLAVSGTFFLTVFLLWAFDWISPYSYQNNIEKYVDDEEQRLFTMKESN